MSSDPIMFYRLPFWVGGFHPIRRSAVDALDLGTGPAAVSPIVALLRQDEQFVSDSDEDKVKPASIRYFKLLQTVTTRLEHGAPIRLCFYAAEVSDTAALRKKFRPWAPLLINSCVFPIWGSTLVQCVNKDGAPIPFPAEPPHYLCQFDSDGECQIHDDYDCSY
jgi:hypothetical protein